MFHAPYFVDPRSTFAKVSVGDFFETATRWFCQAVPHPHSLKVSRRRKVQTVICVSMCTFSKIQLC